MVKKNENQERELDITYSVRIKTFGKAAKHVDDMGYSLSQLCHLNFGDVEVKRGKTIYEYADRNERYGRDIALVDTANYSDVTSDS